MSNPNSFDSRAKLTVGERDYEIYRLDALQAKYDVARLPYSLKILLENLLRTEDGEAVTAADVEKVARWNATARAERRDRVHAQPRADAGLHGRAGDRRPRRDARRDGGDGRGSRQDQPAGAGGARDRPLDPGRRVPVAHLVQPQRRAGVPAQPRALRLPALGPDRLRQLRRGAAQHGHLPPGQPRVPGAGGVRPRRRGLPRHAGGHRLPHHDDQRPRRAGLGRRRHRGGGRDAGPAGVDAAAAGGGLQAHRRAARGHDGHRPRAHGHPDAAREGRGGQVRGVLRRGPGQHAAGRPRHDREHVAGVRRHLRDLPGGRRDAALPRVHGPPTRARRAGGGLRQGAGALPRREHGGGHLQRHARARHGHGRAQPRRPEAPAGPRAGARGAARPSARRSARTLARTATATPCTTRTRRPPSRSRPATRRHPTAARSAMASRTPTPRRSPPPRRWRTSPEECR